MTDETKDEPVLSPRLMDAARAMHEPPPPPREEMWARIREVRDGDDRSGQHEREARVGREEEARRRGPSGRAVWQRPLVWAPVAIAATLILGIYIDRNWLAAPATQVGTPTSNREDLFARYAAKQTFGQAEVLLTQYRSDVNTGAPAATTPAEARRLLVAIRLLLDSPTLTDQPLRDLLEDLELVLAQIAADSDQVEDRAQITDGLDRREVLPRLRAATPLQTGVQPTGAI